MSAKLRIQQIKSASGHTQDQHATLRALGIRRMQHTVGARSSRPIVWKERRGLKGNSRAQVAEGYWPAEPTLLPPISPYSHSMVPGGLEVRS